MADSTKYTLEELKVQLGTAAVMYASAKSAANVSEADRSKALASQDEAEKAYIAKAVKDGLKQQDAARAAGDIIRSFTDAAHNLARQHEYATRSARDAANNAVVSSAVAPAAVKGPATRTYFTRLKDTLFELAKDFGLTNASKTAATACGNGEVNDRDANLVGALAIAHANGLPTVDLVREGQALKAPTPEQVLKVAKEMCGTVLADGKIRYMSELKGKSIAQLLPGLSQQRVARSQ